MIAPRHLWESTRKDKWPGFGVQKITNRKAMTEHAPDLKLLAGAPEGHCRLCLFRSTRFNRKNFVLKLYGKGTLRIARPLP
jgi:hypothetical protein